LRRRVSTPSARTNISAAVESGAASDTEPDVHEDYVSAYDLERFAESARFVRHYPEQNLMLRDLLPTITSPTQIVAGHNDDLVPRSNNQYLESVFRTARFMRSTPVTMPGSRPRRNMAASSPTG